MKMVEEKKPTEILFQQKNNNNEQNKTKWNRNQNYTHSEFLLHYWQAKQRR